MQQKPKIANLNTRKVSASVIRKSASVLRKAMSFSASGIKKSNSGFRLSASTKYFAAAIMLLASFFGAPTLPVRAQNCADVQFVFARGSGEKLGDVSYMAWKNALAQVLQLSPLKADFYELGARKIGDAQYPAVAVDDLKNSLGAFVSGGKAFAFGESVRQGQDELTNYINEVSARCPNTKFVLGGYSQGAMVMSGALARLDAEKIIYVATFGDPKLYLPEGKPVMEQVMINGRRHYMARDPIACSGKNLSPYRAFVPDCRAYNGILGGLNPYQAPNYAGKIGAWCNGKDVMCSSGQNMDDHVAYASAGLYDDAANVIFDKILARFPQVVLKSRPAAAHNVAFLLDATDSMTPTIDSYKAEALTLAERVKKAGGEVALFEYRDLWNGGGAQMHCDFSCDLTTFATEIGKIKTRDGGDIPESALAAMMTAMNTLKWQNGATKSIVLLTDAGYHKEDKDGTTLLDVIRRSLEIDPVNVYVMAPEYGLKKYRTQFEELTNATGGRVFSTATDIELSTEVIFGRPVAKLDFAEYSVRAGDTITFGAGKSYSPNGGALTFDWDLDGDGVFERTNAGAVVSQKYDAAPANGFVQVRANDASGNFATMSAKVQIGAEKILAEVSEITATQLSATSARVDFATDGAQVLLAVNDAVYGFLPAGARSVTLNDLTENATVTLTPYDADGERGISASVQVAGTPEPSAKPSVNAGEKPTSVEPSTIAIPKAPNTGVRPKSLL